ncbi:MAG: hypothetical protein ACP5JX_04190 [Sulfurihydrogenibium sp.]
MLKLGSFNNNKKVKETLTFKEFITKHKQTGSFIITYLFAPSKYPTGGLIFETDTYKVKFILSKEYWEAVKNAYNIRPTDIVGVEFYFTITDNDYGIEKVENNSNVLIPVYEYDKFKKYFKLIYKDKATLSEPDTVDF